MGSYRFKTGFYGLCDMLKFFQSIMNRLTEKLLNSHCYLDEMLIATVGSAKEHCKFFTEVQRTLNDEVK